MNCEEKIQSKIDQRRAELDKEKAEIVIECLNTLVAYKKIDTEIVGCFDVSLDQYPEPYKIVFKRKGFKNISITISLAYYHDFEVGGNFYREFIDAVAAAKKKKFLGIF
jgi:hypothetical protein